MPPRSAELDFDAVLQTLGIRPALTALRSVTPYRYAAILTMDEAHGVRAAHFVDAQEPDAPIPQHIDEAARACCFWRAHDDRSNALHLQPLDPQGGPSGPLQQEPGRDAALVRACGGQPILTPEGQLLGTLVFYDDEPRDRRTVSQTQMIEAAAALGRLTERWLTEEGSAARGA